jgi:leader peptidase (prepilin peptidase)/N-methyltransferase
VDGQEALLATDLPAWLVRTTAALFGALWGSFFNVAIYRWPRGMSVVKPPSHCPACGAPVRWYRNVPVLAYLWMRGRASCCGAKLTPRYVWVEALSGVLGLAVAERFFVNADGGVGAAALETALYFTFVGGLLIATFVDLEWMEIPDEVSLPGAALGLATVGLRSAPGAVSAAVGAGVGFLIVQVLFVWTYELLTGRRGMGEGDAKLLLYIGAFLGWEAVLFALVAGSLQGLIAAGLATALGIPLVPSNPELTAELARASAATPSPLAASVSDDAPGRDPGQSDLGADEPSAPMMVFGPMLALSALEFLFFGDAIVAWLALRLGG